MTIGQSTMPVWLVNTIRRLAKLGLAALYDDKARYCPVCSRYSSRFRRFGAVPRQDAQCIRCGALERHRLLWLYLLHRTDLFDGIPKTMLHVAPERCFESTLKERLGNGYYTADFANPEAMIIMDITNISFGDESFDVIYCSHVLEHVQDDKKAMRELFRVLKKDGWAILLVPITAAETFEDSSIVEPRERLAAFGQEDHVRRYGPDYVSRLRSAGFHVSVVKPSDMVSSELVNRMGLTPAAGEIYFCTKQ